VEHGHRQLDRDRISYISDNYDPLIASGQMTLLAGCAPGKIFQIVPGITCELFPGHTAQLMAIHIDSAGKRATYISDLIPTSAHLDSTWVMGYDLYPLTCIEERKRFYRHAIPEKWLVLFTHDHDHPMGRIHINHKGKPVLHPVDESL
jgi:glyoxylase-like metal-dependent hydrolase (beta-lactamase superfamily II)